MMLPFLIGETGHNNEKVMGSLLVEVYKKGTSLQLGKSL